MGVVSIKKTDIARALELLSNYVVSASREVSQVGIIAEMRRLQGAFNTFNASKIEENLKR